MPPTDAQVGELVAELARARGKLAAQDEALREREREVAQLRSLSEGLRLHARPPRWPRMRWSCGRATTAAGGS